MLLTPICLTKKMGFIPEKRSPHRQATHFHPYLLKPSSAVPVGQNWLWLRGRVCKAFLGAFKGLGPVVGRVALSTAMAENAGHIHCQSRLCISYQDALFVLRARQRCAYTALTLIPTVHRICMIFFCHYFLLRCSRWDDVCSWSHS